ncbi:hypothetical protein C1H46_023197 [Malus baccata]|uniref:Uncharacterized protein n=1 Tax=Malus baccata TaxID=106549 RepID=A0A540LXF1_MALBA|nr:hypothetical protein C1H46_023197 [Malus baccata]
MAALVYQILSSSVLVSLGLYHMVASTRNHLKSPKSYNHLPIGRCRPPDPHLIRRRPTLQEPHPRPPIHVLAVCGFILLLSGAHADSVAFRVCPIGSSATLKSGVWADRGLLLPGIAGVVEVALVQMLDLQANCDSASGRITTVASGSVGPSFFSFDLQLGTHFLRLMELGCG